MARKARIEIVGDSASFVTSIKKANASVTSFQANLEKLKTLGIATTTAMTPKELQASQAAWAALNASMASSVKTGKSAASSMTAVGTAIQTSSSTTKKGLLTYKTFGEQMTQLKETMKDVPPPEHNANMGRTVRGALAGAGAFTQLGRSIAYASTSFLAFAVVSGVIRSAVTAAVQFYQALSRTIGLAGGATRQVEQFGEQLLKLAPQVAVGPVQLAQALYYVASAGIQASKQMSVVKNAAKASAAGLGDVQTVADAITSAMNSYGQANLSAAAATNVLVNTVRFGKGEASTFAPVVGNVAAYAAQLGVSFNEVGAALAVMTRLGTPAYTAAIQLQAVFSSLIRPTVSAQKALSEVGLSFHGLVAQLQQHGLLSVLITLRKALGDNSEALGAAFSNVRALRGVLALAGKSVNDTKQVFDQMRDSSHALAIAWAAASKDPAVRFQKFQATLQALQITIGSALLPVITRISDALGVWLSKDDNIKKLNSTIRGTASAVVDVVKAIKTLLTPVTDLAGLAIKVFNGWDRAFKALAVGFIALKVVGRSSMGDLEAAARSALRPVSRGGGGLTITQLRDQHPELAATRSAHLIQTQQFVVQGIKSEAKALKEAFAIGAAGQIAAVNSATKRVAMEAQVVKALYGERDAVTKLQVTIAETGAVDKAVTEQMVADAQTRAAASQAEVQALLEQQALMTKLEQNQARISRLVTGPGVAGGLAMRRPAGVPGPELPVGAPNTSGRMLPEVKPAFFPGGGPGVLFPPGSFQQAEQETTRLSASMAKVQSSAQGVRAASATAFASLASGARTAAAGVGTAFVTMTVRVGVAMKALLISMGWTAIMLAAGEAALYVINHWEQVKRWMAAFWTYLKAGFMASVEAIKQFGKAAAYYYTYPLMEAIKLTIEGLDKIGLGSLLKKVGVNINAAKEWINQIQDGLKPQWEKVGQTWGQAAADAFKQAMTGAPVGGFTGPVGTVPGPAGTSGPTAPAPAVRVPPVFVPGTHQAYPFAPGSQEAFRIPPKLAEDLARAQALGSKLDQLKVTEKIKKFVQAILDTGLLTTDQATAAYQELQTVNQQIKDLSKSQFAVPLKLQLKEAQAAASGTKAQQIMIAKQIRDYILGIIRSGKLGTDALIAANQALAQYNSQIADLTKQAFEIPQKYLLAESKAAATGSAKAQREAAAKTSAWIRAQINSGKLEGAALQSAYDELASRRQQAMKDEQKLVTQHADLVKSAINQITDAIDSARSAIGDLFSGPVLQPSEDAIRRTLGLVTPSPAVAGITKDVNKQADLFASFNNAIVKVGNRLKKFLPKQMVADFTKEILALGPEAMPELTSLLGASDAAFKKFAAAYKKREILAEKTALIQMRADKVNLFAKSIVAGMSDKQLKAFTDTGRLPVEVNVYVDGVKQRVKVQKSTSQRRGGAKKQVPSSIGAFIR